MDDRKSLATLQRAIQELGQEAFGFERRCPHCQTQFQEFWQRLDYLDLQTQRLSAIADENNYLRYKIDRHQDFGEPLD